MKECIHSKFILDGEVVNCSYFQPDMIDTGTSIYEVIRIINNRFLFAEDHLRRLKCSARLGGFDLWYTAKEITLMINRLPGLNAISKGNIKIVFNYLDGKKNHFLVYFVGHRYPRSTDYKKGVKVITFPFTREDPNKKIWLPGFRSRIKDILIREKVYEALLVDKKNHITEASKANFFTIKNGTVFTPPAENVLQGITRKYVIIICRKLKIPVLEKEILKEELKNFESAFITGTSPKVLPISKIDHLTFRLDNPILMLLMKEYEDIINREIKLHDIDV